MHLVTGGLGFIGNELVRQLNQETEVAVLDNHGQFAALILTSNKVPFVWAATISGLAICLGGGATAKGFGLAGLLATVFIVQAAWNNWWVPWLAWKSQHASNN